MHAVVACNATAPKVFTLVELGLLQNIKFCCIRFCINIAVLDFV